jgi:hypothetical protein
VHDCRRLIESRMEEFLVGFDLERLRHVAGGVGDHSVRGNDGVALDPARIGAGKQAPRVNADGGDWSWHLAETAHQGARFVL